jgi:hypothetical protein
VPEPQAAPLAVDQPGVQHLMFGRRPVGQVKGGDLVRGQPPSGRGDRFGELATARRERAQRGAHHRSQAR